MASPKKTGIVLPWESRVAFLREVVYEGRIRWIPVAVAGLLAIAWGVSLAIHRHDVESTRRTIDDVHRALDAFRVDYGRCPATMRELLHPPRTGHRYLDAEPVDAWGAPLWIRCPGRYDPEGADVVSAGPSGNFLDADNVQ
jgi:hypothetical protein